MRMGRAGRAAERGLRQWLRSLDLQIMRYSETHEGIRARIMEQRRVSLLLDVGANRGEYVAGVRAAGFAGRIVSFEPLRPAFEDLERVAARDSRWTCMNVAVGEKSGDAVLYIAGNSVSSSLLPMLERHIVAASDSGYVGEQPVQLVALDDVAPAHGWAAERIALKLDVQGKELDVLRGASSLLASIEVIETELSLVPLYEGQPLLADVAQYLCDAGFVVGAVTDVFRDERTQQLLQVDCVFFRTEEG